MWVKIFFVYDIWIKELSVRAYFLFQNYLPYVMSQRASRYVRYDKHIAITLIAFSVCSYEIQTDMQDINVSTAFAFTTWTGVLVSETVRVHTPT